MSRVGQLVNGHPAWVDGWARMSPSWLEAVFAQGRTRAFGRRFIHGQSWWMDAYHVLGSQMHSFFVSRAFLLAVAGGGGLLGC